MLEMDTFFNAQVATAMKEEPTEFSAVTKDEIARCALAIRHSGKKVD
jgi:hypothetical protein